MLTRTLRGQLALQGLCPRGWKYAPKQCVWIERRKRVFFANCAGRTVCVGGGEKIWNSSGFCATEVSKPPKLMKAESIDSKGTYGIITSVI